MRENLPEWRLDPPDVVVCVECNMRLMTDDELEELNEAIALGDVVVRSCARHAAEMRASIMEDRRDAC